MTSQLTSQLPYQLQSQLPAGTDLSSPLIKLITEWDVGFKQMNAEIIGKFLHKDFTRSVHPRSLGQPEQNKEDFLQELSGGFAFATGFDTTAHSIILAPGKVVIHSTTQMKNEVGLEAIHESLTILHIVTDGDGSLKVKKVEDFLDSQVHLSMRAALAAAHANK